MASVTETLREVKHRTRRTVKRGETVKTVEKVRVKRVRTRTRKAAAGRPNGVILYRGPSLLDGHPIVCVAVGLARSSKNAKTGKGTIQTYILGDDRLDPIQAIKADKDVSICGNCPHRGGNYYVNVTQAPLAIYRAVQSGKYPTYKAKRHAQLFAGRYVRLGSYGDPAAVPLHVREEVCGLASHWTGYTHQWRTCETGYARFCMASVETPAQRLEALEKGYRTFRVRLPEQPIEQGEVICPASEEAGRRLTCEECGACSGAKAGGRNVTPVIYFHGPNIAANWKLRLYRQAVAEAQAEDTRRISLL
jgi:hypothetical protein